MPEPQAKEVRLRKEEGRVLAESAARPLRIDFVTLFPEMSLDAVSHSILGRAASSGLVEYHATNPRDFATDKHRTVDDTPFGGGPGMVMKCEPVAAALRAIPVEDPFKTAVVMTDPTGKRFEQADAKRLSQLRHVVFVCGHYEGIDDRIRELYATDVFSIGDDILTGGELPALVMCDAIVRLLPGVLGSAESLEIDAHSQGLLSAPQFTRPEVFEGVRVPEELCRGDHGAKERWKRKVALNTTRRNRPDLFCRAELDKADLDLLS